MPQHTASQHADRTFQAWLVILSASLYFFYEFIQLNLFNAIDVPLMRDFHLGAAGLGQLASLYFYANATFLFPAGIMLDRFSTRRLLLVAVRRQVAARLVLPP